MLHYVLSVKLEERFMLCKPIIQVTNIYIKQTEAQ